MDDAYLTIGEPGESIYREKGSRFIGYAFHIKSEDHAKDIIARIAGEHHTSRHVCFAYRVNPESTLERLSDAGEPFGTAGMPIMQQIRQRNLINAIVIVVRYFGGVLLGTGGLIQAYREAAVSALDNCTIVEDYILTPFSIEVNYEEYPVLFEKIKQLEGEVTSSEFTGGGVHLKGLIRSSRYPELDIQNR